MNCTDCNAVNDFKYVCAKGPRKARVMNIVEKVYNKPLIQGFIISQSVEEKIKSKLNINSARSSKADFGGMVIILRK